MLKTVGFFLTLTTRKEKLCLKYAQKDLKNQKDKNFFTFAHSKLNDLKVFMLIEKIEIHISEAFYQYS